MNPSDIHNRDPYRDVGYSSSMYSVQSQQQRHGNMEPYMIGMKPLPVIQKLRFFTLVVNTANLINERSTQSLGRTHAILAPVTIFVIYIFLGCFLVGACFKQYGSHFLQAYALLMCSFMECCLAYKVFDQLMKYKVMLNINWALVLNGVLPTIKALILISDLVVTLFHNRRTDIVIEAEDNS